MDDSCAVCAETLEWVAYGPCGHKDVCSTCIIRLRFICADSTCCICKTISDSVFVTKALGEYTTVINDFESFPENPKEGKVENYWYHEGTKAYFDDLDHYKTVKAMCRLSCSVCDKEDEYKDGKRKRNVAEFNNIEKLKGHLFHRHFLFMCSLCLESRKVFISEQKLYNRVQLSQHVKSGDSEVDGSESERCGFMGHPICEFCRDPFYGDNELYLHMSTDHFNCHICRRQNPGKYEYYRDYDDLEMHFRHQHFLCEDEDCLGKKFIVFASESEMKRHNVMEHRGHMSRSKRNAALQILVSFQYWRGDEQDRHGRGHVNHIHSFDNQSMVTEGSLETATANTETILDTSLNNRTDSGHRGRGEIDLIVPFESLTTTDPEPSSRCLHIPGTHSTTALLEGSSFPPLPLVLRDSQIRSRKMAAHLQKRTRNSSWTSLAKIQHFNSSAGNSKQSNSRSDAWTSPSHSHNYSQSRQTTVNDCVPPNHGSCNQTVQSIVNGRFVSSDSTGSSRSSSSLGNGSHCATAPTFCDRRASDECSSSYSTQVNGEPPISQPLLKAKDVQQANKALVKIIREALDFDKDKFSAFKIISSEYRQNLIGTAEYLAYVHQFGLSDHVLELAKICPDAQKQKELIEICTSNTRNGSNGIGSNNSSGESRSKKSSKQGKEKCDDDGICRMENPQAEGINGARDAEASKNGYHSAKGKLKILVDEQANSNSSTEPGGGKACPLAGGWLKKQAGAGEWSKPRKRTSTFLINRVGENSNAASYDVNSDGNKVNESKEDKSVGLAVQGVWRNGGGQKLMAMTQREAKVRMLYKASR